MDQGLLIPQSVLAQILQHVQQAERLGSCALVSAAFAEAAAIATHRITCSNRKQTESLQQYLDKHGQHVRDLTYTQDPKEHLLMGSPTPREVGSPPSPTAIDPLAAVRAAIAAVAASEQTLKRLPCPNLQQLQLADATGTLQLGPALLHAVTGLTKLSLTAHKGFVGGAASLTALSALPSLQDMSVKLSLDDFERFIATPEACDFIPADVLRHLTKLSAVDLDGAMGIGSLHPVTCLGALQSLSLELWYGLQPAAAAAAAAVSGAAGKNAAQQGTQELLSRQQHSKQLAQQSMHRPQQQQQRVSEQQQLLQQLSHLALNVQGLEFTSSPSSSCPSFAGLTSLQTLNLQDCSFDPTVLGSMCGLQHLTLTLAKCTGDFGAFLSSLSRLQHLISVSLCDTAQHVSGVPPAAYAALTSSSKLEYFRLADTYIPSGAWQFMFPAQRQLPGLRSVTLQAVNGSGLTTDHIKRIVACCPNLEGVILHVQQSQQQLDIRCLGTLKKLQYLNINWMNDQAAAVLPQLTKLRTFIICRPGVISVPAMLQLTSLTALTRLSTSGIGKQELTTKAPKGSPPDVWYQVLQVCTASAVCQDIMLRQQSELLQKLHQAGLDDSAVQAAIHVAQARKRVADATEQLLAAQNRLEVLLNTTSKH